LEAGDRPESPFLYREGDEGPPSPAVCAPSPFVQYSDVGGTARIEIARGCKFKCAFCALSGIKPYQEVPFGEVVKQLDTLKPGRCSLFAPERLYHSEWAQFRQWLNEHKGIKDDTRQRIEQPREKPAWRDLGSDARLERLSQVAGWEAITGIEGISYRLRKSIGKPFTQEFILQKCGEFVTTRPGIARLTMYFIADLPGETEEDWAELYELFGAIETEEWSRHLVMFPVLNPLSPKPFTALENAIIHPFRDYTSRWRALCRNEAKGRLWGFRVVETIVWGPFDRIMDAIITRGGAQGYEIVRRLPRRLITTRVNSGKQVEMGHKLLEEAQGYGMTEMLLGVAT